MAACGSLEHIFEKPLSEPPTFLESLSPWKHIKSMKQPFDDSSFTEIFGELHFKENHVHSDPKMGFSKNNNFSSSYSSKNSESLSLCTEGLGFESFDDVEDSSNHEGCNKELEHQEGQKSHVARNLETENHRNESKISSRTGEFPPPISCIGRSGKPWVCFKSFREDGRFILKEIRIPTQEFLHACRENGRLKLHFVHSESDDEILDVEEDDEEEEEPNDDDDQDNREFDLQSSSIGRAHV